MTHPLSAAAAPDSRTRLAYLLLLLTTFFWGCNAIAGRLAPEHISPAVLTACRWFGTSLLLGLFARGTIRRDWHRIRQHWRVLFGLGIVGFTLFNLSLYTALNFTTAINVSVAQAGIPLAIVALNLAFFAEPVKPALVAAILLGIVGVAIVALRGDLGTLLALDVNPGDAIMAIAIVCYAGYTVALKRKPEGLAWQSTMVALSVGAALASLPGIGVEWWAGASVWPDATGWAIAVFAILFPSLISQVLFIRANELIGPNRAGLFINLIPIWGAGLAIILLGEKLETYHIVAGALVLIGIVLAERFKPRAPGS